MNIIKSIPIESSEPPDWGKAVVPEHHGLQFEQLIKELENPVPEALRPKTAPELLRKAQEVMEDRAREYDRPQGERSVGAVVVALNAILGRQALSESEGWLFMQLLKQVRLFSAKSYHADSGLDGIAYSALLAEAKSRE